VRRVRLAVLGGTFDHLHVGHHALLATAFRVGEEVAVGLTTDRFVAEQSKPGMDRIQPFPVRRAALARWIRRNYPGRAWRVVPLADRFGRSLEPDVKALVVSRDTFDGGRAVNRERRRLHRPSVPLVVVPLVLAEDLEPVSSRRIRAGVIDPAGRRQSPIGVQVLATTASDRAAARRALRRVFPRVYFRSVSASGTPAPGDLLLQIRPRAGGGWKVSQGSRRIRFQPRRVPGATSADLERGLVSLLRPRHERKLFGTSRSSRP